MSKKSFLLLAAAGLLAFAFAGPGADSPIRGTIPAQRRQFLQSLRKLSPEARHTALRQWLSADKAPRQAMSGRRPGTPRRLGTCPFGAEFMPAPDSLYWNDYPVDQSDAAVAFDGLNYLVVWYMENDMGTYEIRGTRVKADGSLVDQSSFRISPSTPDHDRAGPAVAFDGTRYLVVWMDWDDGNIHGALVDTNRTVTNIASTISSNGLCDYKVSIASNGDKFLVAWDEYTEDYYNSLIVGALVNNEGTIEANAIPVGYNEDYYSDYPSIASDGANYLAVWEEYSYSIGSRGVIGARVAGTGEVTDPDGIVIASAAVSFPLPAIDFDGTNYLVVWQDLPGSDYNIYGELVHTDGSHESQFTVCNASGAQQEPTAAFDGIDYFVAWDDSRDGNTYDIFGCRVNLQGGIVGGTDFTISTRGYAQKPALACGPAEGTAIVVYHSPTDVVGSYDYDGCDRIWARVVDTLPLDGDISTLSIERPVASFLNDETYGKSWGIPPMASIHADADNDGPRSFKATFTITKGGSEVYSKTQTLRGLKAGETRVVTFYPFELSSGLFTSKCTTMLAGDVTPGNDRATAIFQGCDFIYFFDEDNHTEFSASTDGGWSWGLLTWNGWAPPPMDETIWGVGRDGDYDYDTHTQLTSPAFEVTQSNPAIAFQHNYNTQAGHDGGNISYLYSTNNGSSWTDGGVLSPSSGQTYEGTVIALGASGWSGNSSGWRQSVFTIPVSSGDYMKVRWNFASDDDEIVGHGWLVDEVAGIGFPIDFKSGRPPVPGAAVNRVSLSSNPLRGHGLLTYTLVRACKVNINLYNAVGRLVRPLATAGYREGTNTARLDANGLNPGVYFVKLVGDDDIKTTKVIIE